jgi:hypothetical protein
MRRTWLACVFLINNRSHHFEFDSLGHLAIVAVQLKTGPWLAVESDLGFNVAEFARNGNPELVSILEGSLIT